jgi:hypothetical protein
VREERKGRAWSGSRVSSVSNSDSHIGRRWGSRDGDSDGHGVAWERARGSRGSREEGREGSDQPGAEEEGEQERREAW